MLNDLQRKIVYSIHSLRGTATPAEVAADLFTGSDDITSEVDDMMRQGYVVRSSGWAMSGNVKNLSGSSNSNLKEVPVSLTGRAHSEMLL